LAKIDGLGRLCDADETISNTSGTVDFSYDFVYDMRSQLKQADIDKNSSPYHNAVYNYRKDGNLDSRTINSSTTNFTYAGDLMDTASGGESFNLDFDDNGNMNTGVSETFNYNWDNKLRSAPALSGNIKYDPSGNRVRKQSVVAGDRKYIVDIVGDLPTTLMEMTDNTILKTYVYANGQVLCQHDGDFSAARYFNIHDRTGSIRQIINTSGSVVRYYTYEPFGEVLEEDGTLTNYMMFTGRYFDTEIDQYYLRARQYDPHISRFTARDPVFGKFEEPLTLHRYLYCGNNLINYTDINGEWAFIVGGSFSGNITLGGASSLTKGLWIIGYYLGVFSQLSQTLECFGAGGTAGAGIFFGKNTDETGWFNTKGWFWGDIRWAAGGGSVATSSGASLTADFGLSPNAMKAEHLGGWFTEYGGSVTFPAPVGSPFFFATAGFTYSKGDTGIDLYTLSGGTGISTWGVGGEGHIYRGYAWVHEW
jgi:RHS repeat-associated protein